MFAETLWMYIDALHEVEADAEYIAGYTEYLEKVQKQAEEQSKTSIFGKKNSFSMRNLTKTAKEFGKLLGKGEEGAVEVSFANNTGIEKWLSYSLGDYFGLLMLVITVMAFLEERKKGLWSIVRTTKGGRRMLGIHRCLILLFVSVFSVAVFNLLPLALSITLNGGHTDFSRAVQSVQSFRTCTIRTSIGGWLARYVFVKSLSGLFVGLFVWFVMGSVSNAQLSMAALVPVLGAEYALFTFLPVQSVFNLFKYLNLFSYVHTARLYTNYLNIDLFTFPVGNRQMMMVLLPLLLIGFLFLCVRMQAERYPEGNRDLLSKVVLRADTLLDRLRRHFTAGIWEAYKSLFPEYGIILILIIILAVRNLNFAVFEPVPEDLRNYYLYVQDMQGPIDEKTDEYLINARKNAEEAGNSFELLQAIDLLEEKTEKLRQNGAEGSFRPYMLYDQYFKAFYGGAPKSRQRLNAMIAMLFAVFLTAGIASYEKQAGVVPMLRSLKKGRKGLFAKKVLVAVLLSVFAFCAVYGRELWQYRQMDPAMPLSAGIRNLDAFASFPLNVTIRGYFVLLYGTRFLMLIMVSFASLYLSSCLPNVRTAYLVEAAVLILPALFTVLGAEALKWISPLIPCSAAELYLAMGEGKWWCMIPLIVWMIVGQGLLVLYGKKWVKG